MMTDMPVDDQEPAAAARAWVARLKSGSATRGEVARFVEWRGAAVENEAAYRETMRLWEALGPARETAEPSRPTPFMAPRASRLSRRAMLGGGAALAASLVAVAIVPGGTQPAGATVTTTRKGERRRVVLAPGSVVELNTDSRLLSWSDERGVRVELDRGEALFEVAGAGLSAVAGDATVRARQARFTLRCDRAASRVVCLDGIIDVRADGKDFRLRADTGLTVDDGVARLVAKAAAGPVTEWRKGVLVFESRPAGEVVDELNRYRDGHVFLPAARAATPISGVIYLDRADLAVDHVARSLGMTVLRLPGGYALLRG